MSSHLSTETIVHLPPPADPEPTRLSPDFTVKAYQLDPEKFKDSWVFQIQCDAWPNGLHKLVIHGTQEQLSTLVTTIAQATI